MVKNIFDNFSVIVGFMVLCLAINTGLGNDVLNKFLLLVLFSMVVLNAEAFIDLIGGNKE